jgi:hypothetical protein
MPHLQQSQQGTMAQGSSPVSALADFHFDTLAQLFQEEGAEEFQHKFLEQIEKHKRP